MSLLSGFQLSHKLNASFFFAEFLFFVMADPYFCILAFPTLYFFSCAKILDRNSNEAIMKKDVLFLTGIENFSTIIEKDAYYVDKTSYLKELFMSSSEVMNALLFVPADSVKHLT